MSAGTVRRGTLFSTAAMVGSSMILDEHAQGLWFHADGGRSSTRLVAKVGLFWPKFRDRWAHNAHSLAMCVLGLRYVSHHRQVVRIVRTPADFAGRPRSAIKVKAARAGADHSAQAGDADPAAVFWHGLIAEVPHLPKWRSTRFGRRVVAPAIQIRQLNFPQLLAVPG